MSDCVYVLYRNTTNEFNHILTQFKRQKYVNKKLIVFDTLNAEKPPELSSAIYVNPEAELKIDRSRQDRSEYQGAFP